MANSLTDLNYECLKTRNISKDKTKLAELIEKELNPSDPTPMNSYEIKNYIYYGFSDNEIRHKYWKLLFNYYSENLFKTEIYYKKSRKSYFELMKNIDTTDKHAILIDNLIKLDLNRTHFLQSKDLDIDKEKINRILLAFSINNSKIGYIQGMINLVIPIYNVLSKDTDMESQKYIEEDTYNMFINFMDEFGSVFIIDNEVISIDKNKNNVNENIENNNFEEEDCMKNIEKNKIKEDDYMKKEIKCQIINDLSCEVISGSSYLQAKIDNVLNIIKNKDLELYKAIIDKKLDVNCFIAKWLLFMFSTEFPINDLLWLWDRILSDSTRFEILEFCCASIFILIRNIILTQDYAKCMNLIQNLSIIDVEVMFDISDVLRRDDQSIIKIIKRKLNK